MTQFIVQLLTLLLMALAPNALESQDIPGPTAPQDSRAVGSSSFGIFIPGSGFVDTQVFLITRRPIDPPVTGKPVSLVKQGRSVFRNSDGTSATTIDVTKWERDSKGRERTEVDRGVDGGMRVLYVIITDPAKQEYIALDSNRRVAQIFHPHKAPLASHSLNASTLPVQNKVELPSKTILGITADGLRTSKTTKMVGRDNKLADIQLTIDSWRSHGLDVELEGEWTYAGMGESSLKTKEIDQSEPDASLFTIPKDYTTIDVNDTSLE